MISGYMLTEARDAKPGEDLWALGHRYRVEGDGQVRFMTSVVPHTFLTEREIARQFKLAADLRQGWDAAFPPATPPDVEFVAGYIGGGTPHVWTDAEWAASLSKSTAQLRLPIFVRVPPTTRDPVVEANFCADWADAHGQQKGTLIALDYETSTVQSYLDAFDGQIVKRGYQTVVYGSRSFVIQLNAPSGGRWTATWNNVPHIDAGAVMTQYGGDVTLGQPYDLNVALDGVKFDTTGGSMTDAQMTELKNYIDLKMRQGVRYLDNGDPTVGFQGNTLKKVRDEVGEVKALATALTAGGLSAQEVADLVIAGVGPEVAANVAALIGAKLSA